MKTSYYGILPAVDSANEKQPLMIGSHIDTVVNAGAFDGCYGVLSGLAVVRAFRKAGIKPSRPITVGAFTNEEGIRYQPDMMGSLVYAGGISLKKILDTVGTDGTRLGDELQRIGYAGDLEPGSIVPHEYIELHIEQGPVLEAEGIQIGAVENLQGISWQEITIKGTANHAGTTPTRLPVLTIRQSRKCLKNGCVLSVILFAQCTKQNVNSFTHMSFHLQSIIRGKLHMQLTQRFAYSAKKMWIPR